MKAPVLMVGPSPEAEGGIASWLGEFSRVDFPRDRLYAWTFRDKGVIGKIKSSLAGYVSFLAQVRRGMIVHIHTSAYSSFWRKMPIYLAGRAVGARVVGHVHGSDFEEFLSCSKPLQRWLVGLVLDQADLVLALSDSWAEVLRKATKTEVVVLRNGVDASKFATAREPSSKILFLGELSDRKGVGDLLRAHAMLTQRKEVPLFLAGGGDVSRFRREAEALGTEGLVKFMGWVGAEQKAILLAEAGIFALPSYREGVPIALLEAMAAGLPVVTTPVGGISEVIEEGVSGFLVPPGAPELLAERLERLLDANLRRKMGAAGQARVVSEFDLLVVNERLEQLYADLERRCPR